MRADGLEDSPLTIDRTNLPQRTRSTSLTLVVPLYNETERVLSSAEALACFVTEYAPGSELLFVDDGSYDGTPALVQSFVAERPELPVRLLALRHRGKGAAVSAGLRSASTEVTAFCDVDLATPLSELARVVDAAARAPILSIGSRGTGSSRITRRQARPRELLGRAFNKVVQLSVVPGVVDTQCGAKAAATVVWKQILADSAEQGFAWDVEVIGLARSHGVSVQEVGIECGIVTAPMSGWHVMASGCCEPCQGSADACPGSDARRRRAVPVAGHSTPTWPDSLHRRTPRTGGSAARRRWSRRRSADRHRRGAGSWTSAPVPGE
jgi:dolichyl-phosphate beta-glucosyltransferase